MKIDIDIVYGQGDLDERYLNDDNEEIYNISETFEDIEEAIKFLVDTKVSMEEEKERLQSIPDDVDEG
jgi:signal transduction histidine kinase